MEVEKTIIIFLDYYEAGNFKNKIDNRIERYSF